MSILPAIQTLRDTVAHSAVDAAIESITDNLDRWGFVTEPEELEHTRFILERLLDLQAAAVRSATTRGSVMSRRKVSEATEITGWFGLASSIALGEGREAA